MNIFIVTQAFSYLAEDPEEICYTIASLHGWASLGKASVPAHNN